MTELIEIVGAGPLPRCGRCGRFLKIVGTASDLEEQTTRIFLRCGNPRHEPLEYYADVKWK